MLKSLFSIIPLLCMSICASAGVLKPVQISVNNRNAAVREYDNISNVRFCFDTAISLKDDAVGYVYDDGNIVAKGSFSIVPLSNDKEAQLNIENAPLLLPLGKEYSIVIPEGVFLSVGNTEDRSDRIELKCNIPEKFSDFDTDIDYQLPDGTHAQHPLLSEGTFMFYYCIELASVDNAKMILCRNDIPIMEFPVGGGWDFGMGFTTTKFGRMLNFEKGVKYTFILPEGSVCSKLRDDMVNAEAKKECYGGYERNFAPIEYESCDVANQAGMSQLNVVKIDYSTPVALAPQARLQLLNAEGDVLKEASATLAESLGTYTLTADFDCVRLDEGSGYVLCIPEATVVGTGEDITVNARNLIPLNGYELSVDNVNAGLSHVRLADGQLHIDNLRHGDRISVYTVDGTSLGQAVATGHSVTVQLPQGTVFCIANVNGRAYKVLGK